MSIKIFGKLECALPFSNEAAQGNLPKSLILVGVHAPWWVHTPPGGRTRPLVGAYTPASVNTRFEVQKILECLKRNHAPPFNKIAKKAS
ncbi:hypothetical protein ES703_50179 [subsurface metagenome]